MLAEETGRLTLSVGIMKLEKQRHKGETSLLKREKNFFFLSFYGWTYGHNPRHMEVPRLGVESELRPLAYTMATATPDPSCI